MDENNNIVSVDEVKKYREELGIQPFQDSKHRWEFAEIVEEQQTKEFYLHFNGLSCEFDPKNFESYTYGK